MHKEILQVVVKLDGSAGICEFDAYSLKHNFGDTLRRQTEHYYCRIQLDTHKTLDHSGAGIVSAHDWISFKHEIIPVDLEGDSHAQNLFIDSLNGISLIYHLKSHDDSLICLESRTDDWRVVKELELSANRLMVTYSFSENSALSFETEINLAMPSCDGPGGRYLIDGTTVLGGFGQLLDLSNVTNITLRDSILQGELLLHVSTPVRLCAEPHFSVSQSEGGYEKIMQAVKHKLIWSVVAP